MPQQIQHEIEAIGSQKICDYCGKKKSLANFRKSFKSPDGYQHICDTCCKFGPRKEAGYYNLQRYGITPSEYAAILLEQGGVCASCLMPETRVNAKTGKIYALSVDHDHGKNIGDYGFVRGLLCHKCNVAVGMLLNSSDRANMLAKYLEDQNKSRK